MHTGIGFDIHRLIPSLERSTIPLGGIAIPCYYKINAHSDGDVVLHALVDACLGSLALGDIGQWFPDSSSENLGRDSHDFVRAVHAHMKSLGWRIVHCDFNVFLEEPKLGVHKENIRREIASLLGIELSSVSVKAKTMEGLGAIGERKAVAAQAVVTVCQSKSPTA